MIKATKRIAAVFILLSVFAVSTNSIKAENFSENNLIFLCFGQSNMEGNAQPRDIDRTGVSNRFMKMYCADSDGTNKGKWATAYPPLCRKNTGLTPVDYFGRYLCDSLETKYTIRVIVVAVAGCSIKLFDKDEYKSYISSAADWMKNIANDYGGNPYGRLISLAKEAQKTGVIKGILLHQGETDAYNDEWITSTNKVYRNILKDLNLSADTVPMLVGGVVHQDQNGACSGANNTIQKLCSKYSTIHYISSSGCTAASDRLHFNAAGYEKIGKRYGAKMFDLLKTAGYDTQTAVESPVSNNKLTNESPIYNINGQQLAQPADGINIINGRKYIFK